MTVSPALLAALLVAAVLLGSLLVVRLRWRRVGRRARAAVRRAAFAPPPPAPPSEGPLPDPVARWLERSGATADRPRPQLVVLHQRGEIRTGASDAEWRAFTARQEVSLATPAFAWEARIGRGSAPGVHVVDGFVEGRGVLAGALAGVVPVFRAPLGRGLEAGELMRWLAEIAWYPSAARPEGLVRWRMKDGRVQARVAAGRVEVGLFFEFNEAGDVVSVDSPRRPRLEGDVYRPAPWRARWTAWGERAGFRVPLAGEAAWLDDDGPRPYWRGELVALEVRGPADGSTRATEPAATPGPVA